jgi:SsrA-binding protein
VLQGEREMARDNRTLGRFHLDGIPPAPRGMPQIEVTFDIDANGILNVKAQDKGTGREQSVTITASSTLAKDEVDRMVKEAELHAGEDRAKREEVELRNQADHMISQAEKIIKDNAERIPDDVKTEVNAKLEALKTAAKGSDTNALRKAMDEFNEALQKIGQHIYQGAGAGGGGGSASGSPQADGQPGEKKKEEDDKDIQVVCRNKRAYHDYDVSDSLECGLVLTGTEVKSLRERQASLEDAYARIDHGEVWLIGSDIPEYTMGNRMNHKPKRPRKLLLHRREIAKFAGKASQRGFTLVPLRLYFKRGRAKVELAVARGKQMHDKRQDVKKAEAQRDIRRAMMKRLKD